MITVIAERINMTRKSIREKVWARDEQFVINEVKTQEAAGATHIDVNAGGAPDEPGVSASSPAPARAAPRAHFVEGSMMRHVIVMTLTGSVGLLSDAAESLGGAEFAPSSPGPGATPAPSGAASCVFAGALSPPQPANAVKTRAASKINEIKRILINYLISLRIIRHPYPRRANSPTQKFFACFPAPELRSAAKKEGVFP